MAFLDENPFLEPEIQPKRCCDSNSTIPIKPPILLGDGTLTEEG